MNTNKMRRRIENQLRHDPALVKRLARVLKVKGYDEPRELAIVHTNGRYILIGRIHEQELHKINCEGFTTWQSAFDTLQEFNYQLTD